jgi:hypothetical protein
VPFQGHQRRRSIDVGQSLSWHWNAKGPFEFSFLLCMLVVTVWKEKWHGGGEGGGFSK